MRIVPLGDRGVSIQFAKEISSQTNEKIQAFLSQLERSNIDGVIEWLPTYTGVTIYYEPFATSYKQLFAKLSMLVQKSNDSLTIEKRVVTIPVVYGGKFGPDLEGVASFHQISEQQVVEKHVKKEYFVHMLGFTPGFPYLGGLDETIATPRKQVPRTLVHAGSVGIAGKQTGIYSIDAPGGWQIIGRTPLRLFRNHERHPFLLKAGDYVRFKQISEEEYATMLEEEGGFDGN